MACNFVYSTRLRTKTSRYPIGGPILSVRRKILKANNRWPSSSMLRRCQRGQCISRKRFPWITVMMERNAEDTHTAGNLSITASFVVRREPDLRPCQCILKVRPQVPQPAFHRARPRRKRLSPRLPSVRLPRMLRLQTVRHQPVCKYRTAISSGDILFVIGLTWIAVWGTAAHILA